MDKFFTDLQNVFITSPLLNTISRGSFFTKAFTWILRVCTVILVIGFFYFSINLWILYAKGIGNAANKLAQLFGKGNSVGTFFIFFFAQLLAIPLFYVLINILLVKANEINALPEKTDYVVVPVAVQLIKMTGEIIATFATVMGVFTTIALLLGSRGDTIGYLGLKQASAVSGASFGYFAFIAGPIFGFLALVLFYSIGELIGALVDIARNTKKK
jgi:hypothetical protein